MSEKILLVDDDLDTLRLVGLMLQRQGYDVRAASNGLQALTMAKNDPPDMILLDIMMPEMDGYEVARRLRADPVLAEIPVIMFTAKSRLDDKVMGFEAGADDYLTKPTQPRELFAHMKAVMARAGKSRKSLAPPPPAAEKGYMIGAVAAKGGLGVTTLALNLGIALHKTAEKEVLVAEFRPGQGSLGLELGYMKPEGLSRLLQRKPNDITPRDVESEILVHGSGVRLLLSSSRPIDAKNTPAVENFSAIARQLPYLARYVVIDLGASITPIADKVLPQCDEVLVVVEPVPPTVIQTKMMIEDLVASGIGEGRINLVLVNRVRSGIQLSWSQVQEQIGHNISVIFTPAPELAYQATVNGTPLVLQQLDNITSQQFFKLADKITQKSSR